MAIFTEATEEKISRILKVYVENPSLGSAAEVLETRHSLIISGPPGVGKTTLAQILAAEYCDDGWSLVAISEIDQAFAVFKADEKQVFVFDDFLGKISLDQGHLSRSEDRISRLIDAARQQNNKRFIMTTRSYVFQAAREISDVLSEETFDLNELVLDLSIYNREIRAKILYNHLYHSDLSADALMAVLDGDFPKRIIDHKNYMPRIVEWMTDVSRLQGVESAQYPNFFMRTLENPEKIWRRAYRKHISENARFLLQAMFFSEFVSFPKPGIRLQSLRPLFGNLIENARMVGKGQSKNAMFEETMREIKSSFAIIEDDRVNFINPSVLDFLANEVSDVEVLELLALSTSRLGEVQRIWAHAKEALGEDGEEIRRIAKAIQANIRERDFEGRLPFYKGSRLFGELLIAHPSSDTVKFIREGGLIGLIWLNESDSVQLIEDLEEGDFRNLPHAKGYARLLRAELYDYIVNREYVIDLEEISELMERISESFVEFPGSLMNALDDAASEAIDCLEPHKIEAGEEPETVLGNWLEHIEKIEGASEFKFEYGKKEEILQALHSFQMHNESMLEEYRERARFHSPVSGSEQRSIRGAKGGQTFSDSDVDSLFSSLKAPSA